MRVKILVPVLLLVLLGVNLTAQESTFSVTGDVTAIYTLGNADPETQKIDDPLAAGAFFNSQTDGTRRNGFYTAVNVYATFKPVDGLEGYFKLYSIHRPGSFHLPLQMENMGRQSWEQVTVDAFYGKANVLKLLGMELPYDLYLKGGRYKAQAAQFGIVSKYKTEQLLYLMNTKTDFTYELGFGVTDPLNLYVSGAINYLFDESVPRYYDEDGAVKHGNKVLNEYAPQFILALTLRGISTIEALKKLNVELLYGQNVSNIYSGNSFGLSAAYPIVISDSLSIPIGLTFAYFEKNVDMLGNAAVADPVATAGNTTTMDFRDTLGAALGVGLRTNINLLDLEFNLAGAYNMVKSVYRTDLNIIRLSADTMITYDKKFFLGGGVFFGTLSDVEWKTTDEALAQQKETDYEHIFTLAQNMGYEIYAGLNLTPNGKFVIGFNDNKGLSLNNMLEAKTEGQMKYKQKDSNWAQDKLAQAGGLYFKFYYKF